MKISKLKKKCRDKDWLLNKINKYAESEKYWNHFEKFECSSFFRGSTLARINRKTYKKNIKRVYRKIEQLEYFLEKVGYVLD